VRVNQLEMAYKKVMKGIKRKGASAGGAKKRPANVTAIKCADVAAAIAKAKTLPDSCRSMLAHSAKAALAVYAAERHAFEVQTVEMAGKAMAAIKASLEKAVAEGQKKVDSSDAEKASRVKAADAAKAKHDALDKAAKGAKEKHDADVAAEAAAKAALKAAEKAIVTNAADLVATEEKKVRLVLALQEVYEPAKATKPTGHDGRKALNSLGKVAKENGTEEALADFLVEALKKEVAERSSFDALVIKEIDGRSGKWTAGVEAAIKAAQQGTTDTANAKTAAEAALAAASEKLPASKAAQEAAEAAEKEQRKPVATAKAAVQSFEKDMAAAATALDGAKSALAAFTDGPAKAFEELKVLAPPPPEPEPVAEPAAAAVVG